MSTEPVATDLTEYVGVLRRGAWLIALVTAGVTTVALLWATSQTPIYAASAEVLVEAIRTATPAMDPGPLIIENEARIATSDRVVSSVRELLEEVGAEPAPTTVDTPTGASTLVFTSESSVPRIAQLTADAYATTYLKERRGLVMGDIVSTRATIEQRIAELQSAIEEKRDALLDADTQNEIDVLGVELDTLTSQLLSEQARLDAIPQPTAIRVGEVLHPAQLPSEPSNRELGKVIALGAFLGLSLGVGLALLRDRLRRPVTNRPALEAAAEAPLAAMIPPFGSSSGPGVPIVDDPRAPAADAFRVLAARILFAMNRQSVRSVMITSAEPQQGKTTTAVNLARSLAESGRSVALVLADLHRSAPPDLVEPDEQRLSGALSGAIDVMEALRPTSVPNLMVIGNAHPVRAAGELSSMDAMRRVITELEETADIVVIDTTPILGPSDALTLATSVDAVLLVAHAHRSTLSRIRECAIELRSVDASILGVVLTAVTAKSFQPYQVRTSYYAVTAAEANGGRSATAQDQISPPIADRAEEQIRPVDEA